MDQTEPSIPPGFRFHPTDEELVGYYLKKKIASQKIDLDVIRDIDLYKIEPWDLQDRCRIGYGEQNEWYFFSHKDKKYPSGTRTNRATMAGFWKATGRDKAVYDKSKLIGMRKTLVFYRGRAPNGQKTDWIMHEYRFESEENNLPQEEGWVVCRAFKKRLPNQTKCIERRDSTYFYDKPNRVSSLVNTTQCNIEMQYPNHFAHNVACKREIEAENSNLVHSDRFVQLPHLDSPSISLPLTKNPSSLSLLSENNEEEEQIRGCNNATKGTDWRALDKFVASQLSQEEIYEGGGLSSSFGMQSNSDMMLLLMQNGRENGINLDGLFSSSSDCDIGTSLAIP